jgi:hypothetical protein
VAAGTNIPASPAAGADPGIILRFRLGRQPIGVEAEERRRSCEESG